MKLLSSFKSPALTLQVKFKTRLNVCFLELNFLSVLALGEGFG